MLFYNVFVAFVGLNNNTILAMQNIEFGSVSSHWYPDPAEKDSIEVIPSMYRVCIEYQAVYSKVVYI